MKPSINQIMTTFMDCAGPKDFEFNPPEVQCVQYRRPSLDQVPDLSSSQAEIHNQGGRK